MVLRLSRPCRRGASCPRRRRRGWAAAASAASPRRPCAAHTHARWGGGVQVVFQRCLAVSALRGDCVVFANITSPHTHTSPVTSLAASMPILRPHTRRPTRTVLPVPCLCCLYPACVACTLPVLPLPCLRERERGWPDPHSRDEGESCAAVPWHLPVASVTLVWITMWRRLSRRLPRTCGTPPARAAPGECVWDKGG